MLADHADDEWHNGQGQMMGMPMSDHMSHAGVGVQVPRNDILLFGGESVLACRLNGQLDEEGPYGLFCHDTRVLSTYRLGIAGHAWHLLGRAQPHHDEAQWHYQNPDLRDPGGEAPAGTLLLTLRRRLATALHDDLHLRSFLRQRMPIRLTLQLDGDFADIFQVHDRSIPAHLEVQRLQLPRQLELRYQHRGFRRGLRVTFDAPGPAPVIVGALVLFDLQLGPETDWRCCLEATPIVEDNPKMFLGDPHRGTGREDVSAHGGEASTLAPAYERSLTIRALPFVARPVARGSADLRSLAVRQPHHPPYVAAGVPWFYTLFGRDPLMAGLMAGLEGPWLLQGALAALAARQAQTQDDFRDAEPGKFLH